MVGSDTSAPYNLILATATPAVAVSREDLQPGAEDKVPGADEFQVVVPASTTYAGPERPGPPAPGDGRPRQHQGGLTYDAARDLSCEFSGSEKEVLLLGLSFGFPKGHEPEAPTTAPEPPRSGQYIGKEFLPQQWWPGYPSGQPASCRCHSYQPALLLRTRYRGSPNP